MMPLLIVGAECAVEHERSISPGGNGPLEPPSPRSPGVIPWGRDPYSAT
ncbi:hypothetical protein [Corynebacterium durum]|nr:hypothetical protein [Corynebacterium durum]NYI74093.1 hypothetical protein [Corynebacterium durum]